MIGKLFRQQTVDRKTAEAPAGRLSSSPLGYFLLVAIAVLGREFLHPLLFDSFVPGRELREVVIESFLLINFTLGFVYLFLVRPLRQQVRERERAERERRQAWLLFERTFTALRDAIFIIGTRERKILDCNPAATEIFGYPREAMLGRTTEFLHVNEESLAAFRELLSEDCRERGFLMLDDFIMRRQDGSQFFSEHSVYPLADEQGVCIGWVSVVRDVTARKLAEEQRCHFQTELEQRISERTAQLEAEVRVRQAAEAKLVTANSQLRVLAAHMEEVREQERKEIAREIHDELGQSLTALKFDAAWLNQRLPDDGGRLRQRMTSMIATVDATIRIVQRLVAELRPRLLDDLGLVAALEWQADEFTRRTGIPCRLKVLVEPRSLDPATATAIFRIFQEALTNVIRHASATAVRASLVIHDGHLELMVRDNGRGIPRERIFAPDAYGLLGIRERAQLRGGEAIISGAAGKGTSVRVRIPHQEMEESNAQRAYCG